MMSIKKSFPNLNEKIKNLFRLGINAFPMVLQSFSLIIFIAQLKFSKYISKIISFIGPLTFDIYLIHDNIYIRKVFIEKSFNQYYNNINISFICFILFMKGIYIFCLSILFAYIRNIIFRLMMIRRICCKSKLIINKIMYYVI